MAKKKKDNGLNAKNADRHILYEASVQSVESSIEFIDREYKRTNKHLPKTLREDFCGTAAMACAWAKMHSSRKAWGVDLDQPTLDWGTEHHHQPLGPAAERAHLVHGDVRTAVTPKVDVIAAFNFSYFIFKQRRDLLSYFKATLKNLKTDGLLILDIFGGTGAPQYNRERRKISKFTRPNGETVPAFRYVWEHASYNVVTNEILCHIHFRFKDGSRMDKAFTYDWRLWSIPEVKELLLEAGYKKAEVYIHGWDKAGDSDDIFLKRSKYNNEEGWIGYVVGYKK